MKSKSKDKNSKGRVSSYGGANSVEWEYFDDCLICQAMEKADKQGRSLSGKELTEAFRKANEKQEKSGK